MLSIFVRDLPAGIIERVSVSSKEVQGNGPSFSIGGTSTYGRYVVFESDATNLVPGDTNKVPDVFVRDRKTKKTVRVSVGSRGEQGNRASDAGWITGDGRYVIFSSDASNLVAGDTNGTTDVFVRDLRAGTTKRVSVGQGGTQGNGGSGAGIGRAITRDGRYVAFTSHATNLVPGDTNGYIDAL